MHDENVAERAFLEAAGEALDHRAGTFAHGFTNSRAGE